MDILLSVTSIQSRQNAASVVDQESQFLLQQIQTQVEQSSIIDIAVNTPTSTLLLRMPSSSIDAVFIYASSTSVYMKQCPNYLQQACAAPTALTSNRVNVSGLTFTRKQNPSSRDLVSISFTMAYNGNNPQQIYASSFDSAIARVNAATFDSGLYPSSNGLEEIGSGPSSYWKDINGTAIYFAWDGSNNPLVGVGTGSSNLNQTLNINGGLQIYPYSISQPTCTSGTSNRGTLWFTPNGSGQDHLYLCANNASGTPGWQAIY